MSRSPRRSGVTGTAMQMHTTSMPANAEIENDVIFNPKTVVWYTTGRERTVRRSVKREGRRST